jgi:hypothetical protein
MNDIPQNDIRLNDDQPNGILAELHAREKSFSRDTFREKTFTRLAFSRKILSVIIFNRMTFSTTTFSRMAFRRIPFSRKPLRILNNTGRMTAKINFMKLRSPE